MFFPALITALIVAIGVADELTLQWQTTRAIVIGPLVGLVLGDVRTGLFIGATVELMFLSNVIVGAAGIPDVTMASAIATALVILGNVPTELAITLAVPVAIFGQFMSTIRFSILGVPLSHLADPYASKGDAKGLLKVPLIGLLVILLLYFVPTFVAVYFGPDLVGALAEQMPTKLLGGFRAGSGLLAAVGFAMLLSMLKTRKLVPFLFIGYVLAAFLKLSILGVVILAVSIASLYILLDKKTEAEV